MQNLRMRRPLLSDCLLAVSSFVAALLAVASCVPVFAQDAAPCVGLEPGPAHSVTRVIDGETLALDDGRELRLIGALAPRALDVDAEAGAWAPENETRSELQSLVLGKSVELHFGGDRLDRYGRLLAQAFLVDGDQRRWVQGHLLAQGFARAYAIAGNRACAVELMAAERPAREARRGLWNEAAYQVREASRDLLSYRSTFQVVEGKVVRAAIARGTIHLNFARNWRQAFSLSLRNADRLVLGPHARDPKGLEGAQVRVRGWIEARRGAPMIDLSVTGLIEFIADPRGDLVEVRP